MIDRTTIMLFWERLITLALINAYPGYNSLKLEFPWAVHFPQQSQLHKICAGIFPHLMDYCSPEIKQGLMITLDC
jgi:hypothetical protein